MFVCVCVCVRACPVVGFTRKGVAAPLCIEDAGATGVARTAAAAAPKGAEENCWRLDPGADTGVTTGEE